MIAVQVFDQKKFKKKDQGFLGVINVQVSSVFDLAVGGDGNINDQFALHLALTEVFTIEMLTLDLKKSNNHDTIQGKLILNISTNVNAPIRNGTNTLASTSRSSVARNASSHSVETTLQPQAQTSIPTTAPPLHTPATATSSSTDNDARNNDLPEG